MAKVAETFRSSMSEDELISGDTVSVKAGQFNILGKYKVQAGEYISIGYGSHEGLHDAVGRMFMSLKDNTPAEIAGKVRLSIYSPQDRVILILGEWDTDIINDNESDRTKQTPLAESQFAITEDKQLVLEFKPKVDTSVVKANSRILFDTTQGVV